MGSKRQALFAHSVAFPKKHVEFNLNGEKSTSATLLVIASSGDTSQCPGAGECFWNPAHHLTLDGFVTPNSLCCIISTPWKFNSKRKFIFQPSIFQGRAVKFWG